MPGIIYLIWILSIFMSVVVGEDYCLGDIFEPKCANEEVIVIDAATYGRMEVGTCLHLDEVDQDIGCKTDVTNMLAEKCSGRNECVVYAADHSFLALRPCGRRMHYLQTSYKCVPVISTGRDFCQAGDILQITSASSSYIASVVTQTSRCGSQQSPWLIEATPGQRIILTLIDFAVNGDNHLDANTCLVYAEVKEPDMQQSTTICGGQERERIVYESVGHRIELKILNQDDDNYFLLNYTFVGCTNMEPVDGVTLRREGNLTRMECEFGEEVTAAYCNGSSWIGKPPNCTEPEPVVVTETDIPVRDTPKKKDDVVKQPEMVEIVETEVVSIDFSSISWGMVLILVGIMTAGLVACVLIIGVVYLKKKSHEVQPPPVFAPRPMSESGYETCDFTVAHRPSSVYRGGYRTLPKDYTPMMNGGQPGYDTDVWERPLPPEPLVNPCNV